MNLENLSIACIGLGRMGAGIAKNVQASGCRLVVYNRTVEKMQPFVAAGAIGAGTAREAASSADVVITSLMDDQSMFDTMLGDNGMLAGMRPGAIHISTSTISPGCSTRCADLHSGHGSHYLAAPVGDVLKPLPPGSCSRSWLESRRSSSAPGRCWRRTRNKSWCWAGTRLGQRV